MGMFNWVKYKGKCPHCKTVNGGWQTKDGSLFCDTVEPESVDNFHTKCIKCGYWLEATVKRTNIKISIKATKMEKLINRW